MPGANCSCQSRCQLHTQTRNLQPQELTCTTDSESESDKADVTVGSRCFVACLTLRTPLRLCLAGLPRSPHPDIPDVAARCTKNNTKGHVACPIPKVRIPV